MNVRWTDEEHEKVAARFVELRADDIIADTTSLMRVAQKVLPDDRQRHIGGVQMAEATLRLVRRKYAILTREELDKLTAPVPVAAPAPPPEPVPAPPPLPPPVPKPEGPFIIEFRIPQPASPGNVDQIIANIPTPMLIGYAMDRFMSGFPKGPLVETIRAVTQPPQAPVVPKVEPPTVLAASIEFPPGTRRQVLVVGLLPDARRLAAEKSRGFSGIDVIFTDGTPRDGVARCDYAILTRGLVTHFQAEQIRRRFLKDGDRRLISLEGGMDELMRELNSINSRQ